MTRREAAAALPAAGEVPSQDYLAFGLRWRSEVPLPLPLAPPADLAEADLTLRIASVPQTLCQPTAERHIDTRERKAHWQAATSEFLYHVDRIGSIHIDHGRTVLARPDMPLEKFGRFMYRVLSIVVLQQRGMTPFHASASAAEDGALLFLGSSGSGKSTLAATLAARGMPLMCDDLTAVRVASSGRVAAWPAFPGVRLWGEAVAKLGEHEAPESLVPGAKLYVPCMARSTPLTVRGVYLLTTTATPAREEVDIVRLDRRDACRILFRNTMRLHYAAGMGCRNIHFRHIVALSKQVPLYRATRPSDHDGAGPEAFAERIEAHWRAG